jgi:hypothetical protein
VAYGPGSQIDSGVCRTPVVEEYFRQQATPKLKKYLYDGNSSRESLQRPRGFESSIYIGPWVMPQAAREAPPRRSLLPPFLPVPPNFVDLDDNGLLRLTVQHSHPEASPEKETFTVPFTR